MAHGAEFDEWAREYGSEESEIRVLDRMVFEGIYTREEADKRLAEFRELKAQSA